MAPKSLSSLIILSLVLLVCSVSANPFDSEPIPDLKAREVQEAAFFAVETHNKSAGTVLILESVKKGDQLMLGTFIKYRFLITASDKGVDADYETIVWVTPVMKMLTSFKKV